MIIGKVTGIYKITNQKGAIYIGQSRDISKRRTSYRGVSPKNEGQPKLYNSLKKYGAENHIFEVIEVCELEELNVKERYWQDYYDACSRKNLNCTLTSTDDTPSVVSDETRKKQSEVAKIRMKRLLKDPEYRKIMRAAYDKRIGVKLEPRSEEYRELRRNMEKEKGNWKGDKNPWFGVDRSGEKNTRWGAVVSEETKAKISASNKGKKATDEAKKKMSENRRLGGNVHAKIVLNIESGVYFGCGKEAWMSQTKYAYSTLKGKLNGSLKINDTPFRYV